MLSEEDENGLRLHVPAVENFNGYVDGQACEITWVSVDRQRVRVRFDNHSKRKRHANQFIDKTAVKSMTGASRSPRLGQTEEELLAETFYTEEEKTEREVAATKVQSVFRGAATRADLTKSNKKQHEIELQKETQLKLLEVKRHEMEEKRQKQALGKEGLIETVDADRVKKVTMRGDDAWMNRLTLELGLTKQEAVDGFRLASLPPDGASILDNGCDWNYQYHRSVCHTA